MKFILGTKLHMTQLFAPDGTVVPVTAVRTDPCVITQIKTKETDGYEAIQVGHGHAKTSRLTSPLKGHMTPSGRFCASLREFTVSIQEIESHKVGDTLSVEEFQEGNVVEITSVSKGRGFQGVVKRHHFSGSPATHGHKDQLRMPGSIGSTDPQRVFKGRRMAGRMGHNRVTLKNVKIVKIENSKNILYLKGAIPGAKGALFKIKAL